MDTLIRMAESGYLPDALIRVGIRRLLRQRLDEERRGADGREPTGALAEQLRQQPIAVAQERANQQHYEVPAEFFRLMLGPWLKYSSCHWSSAEQTLEGAEAEMLLRASGGGTMPSLNLLERFDRDLRVTRQWSIDGTHYQRTLLAWLRNLDDRRTDALRLLEGHYPAREARRWFVRWRLFLLGCAELFGYDQGREWMVAHYLLEPTT